jgi:hypothetical protein
MLPKPAFKYSEALRQTPPQIQDSGTVEFASAVAEAVIGCPSCRTSFAVEERILTSASDPKFHCSKCDSIFSLSASAAPQRISHRAESATDLAYSPTRAKPSSTRAGYGQGYGQSSVRASDFSIGTRAYEEPELNFTSSAAAKHDISPTPRAGISLLETSSDELYEDFDTETPRISEYADLLESDSIEPQSSDKLPSVTEKLFSGGFDIGPASRKSTVPQQQPTPKKPVVQEAFSSQNTAEQENGGDPVEEQIEQHYERIDDETYNQALQAQRGILHRSWLRLSARNRSLIAMSAPLLATIALLLSLTPLTSISPQSVGALIETLATSVISSQVAQTPPSSLAIKNASLKFVRARSQESLAIVSGELVNTSNAKIAGVNLEALIFNRRGEILATSRAQLHSALAKENITDLNLATVRKFQNSLNARSASIGGGESVPFTIAILNQSGADGAQELAELDLSKVKYFSARVFSIN